MGFKDKIGNYVKSTKPVLWGFDITKYTLVVLFLIFGNILINKIVMNQNHVFLYHRKIFNNPDFSTVKYVYKSIYFIGISTGIIYALTMLKNIFKFTILRQGKTTQAKAKMVEDHLRLPDFPYDAASFAVVLGELQDRDGSRVPNERNPHLKPRWLILKDKALFTGIFVTGGIGSGKTASVGKPILTQMINHVRFVPIMERNAKGEEIKVLKPWVWSGLVTDEKGDFCSLTEEICKKAGRLDDFIRLAPKGPTLWNVIYNPAIEAWSIGAVLAAILQRFNKGQQGSDPFWTQAPKEMIMDYLMLLSDANDYYSISDYLEVLIREDLQDLLQERSIEKWKHDPKKMIEIEKRGHRIHSKRDTYGQNLMGSLQACAKAGLALFEFPEIRETFSPTREAYFTGPASPWPRRIAPRLTESQLTLPTQEQYKIQTKYNEMEANFSKQHETGILLPKSNVFTGFDTALDYGKIVGLDMPKTRYYEAATFMQIALKSSWQEAVFRRDTRDEVGNYLTYPRFGAEDDGGTGYCPTFIVADECQESVDPKDQNFMAQCRSKRACCVWLTQSHTSIIEAMGGGKKEAADAFFQNAMTHIYFRQSDLESMKKIEKEVGTKDVVKTSVSVSEGGQQSAVNFVSGDIVHEGVGVSETKSTQLEEKPYFETEQLKQLPDFTAVVIASTGQSILPATMCFMRPSYVFSEGFQKHVLKQTLDLETSWHDWPESLKIKYTLENVEQKVNWKGYGDQQFKEIETNVSGFLSAPVMADLSIMDQEYERMEKEKIERELKRKEQIKALEEAKKEAEMKQKERSEIIEKWEEAKEKEEQKKQTEDPNATPQKPPEPIKPKTKSEQAKQKQIEENEKQVNELLGQLDETREDRISQYLINIENELGTLSKDHPEEATQSKIDYEDNPFDDQDESPALADIDLSGDEISPQDDFDFYLLALQAEDLENEPNDESETEDTNSSSAESSSSTQSSSSTGGSSHDKIEELLDIEATIEKNLESVMRKFEGARK